MKIRHLLLAAACAVAALDLPAAEGRNPLAPLHVHENGRVLVSAEGKPVFLLADTAWDMAERLKRPDIEEYLNRRRAQGFNAVTFVCFHSEVTSNAYGAAPFVMKDGKLDPTQPVVTPGSDPSNPAEYDYWDHVDYAIDQAARAGLYAIALPNWGHAVTGGYNGKPTQSTVLDARSAYAYGRWLGARYRDRKHVIWMLGGDVAGQYKDHDYREVFRAEAEGIADGAHGGGAFDGKADYANILMSFHPQKPNPQSSKWFHGDPWLSFNSIQAWPEDQIRCISEDWEMAPAKPTWIFEGRYEAYYKGGYKPEQWGEWQCRQQAWQTVFAGAFGHTYGHEHIFSFGHEEGGWDWKKELESPGAKSVTILARFMNGLSAKNALTRQPDQGLIEGGAGKAERLRSDRITAMRAQDGTFAMVYSANGRTIRLRMARLAKGAFAAHWLNPRSGKWFDGRQEHDAPAPFEKNIAGGAGAAVKAFDPPGEPSDGNDWVLALSAGPGL